MSERLATKVLDDEEVWHFSACGPEVCMSAWHEKFSRPQAVMAKILAESNLIIMYNGVASEKATSSKAHKKEMRVYRSFSGKWLFIALLIVSSVLMKIWREVSGVKCKLYFILSM